MYVRSAAVDTVSEGKRKLNSTPKKRPFHHEDTDTEVYNFKVLLPNGTTVTVAFPDPQPELSLAYFIRAVKDEYKRTLNPGKRSRTTDINWTSDQLSLYDPQDRDVTTRIRFADFHPFTINILTLSDGSATPPDTFENMWDLTPDTELLMELPEEYSFEAALAELIDNSLQAVWNTDANERRLISVEVDGGKISVFDTGPGMDASEQYSIVKWGKMGASLHRSYKRQTIGGNLKPPYLVPFFGMFGYGGSIASMNLGRRALVSSKRRDSKKVYSLNLEREALLSNSGSGPMWKTDGGMSDPLEDDIQKSPHGSFTKVEIFRLKMKSFNISELQWRLKDIYFPYIQCDEQSSAYRTATPIEFEVNGVNLAEVEGGEFAVTNWFSSNGPDFILQIRLSETREGGRVKKAGRQIFEEANACLKCVYFPMKEGKERIDMILEKLKAEGLVTKGAFRTFNRVSIRRLGRLLPDARWGWLPFMDLRQKKGERAQILKRCCMRVKCFIDTDGGFSPTRSKTDLVHHHAFTTALKNFGNKSFEKDKEVNIDIFRNGKKLSTSQLEKEYLEWICNMHDTYDDENECGEDQAVLVITPNKKRLGISSDVVRVHLEIRRNGILWKSGQKIKILKGTCAGCHKRNVYATLERIVLGGFEGDAGGESLLICRPIDLQDDQGSALNVKDGVVSLDVRCSLSVPLNAIDSGKCVAVETAEWNVQLAKLSEKAPTMIELFSARNCEDLDIDGALPLATAISAGQAPPQELVAVIRPKCFTSSAPNTLEQKYIINVCLEMSMEVKFSAEGKDFSGPHHVYSVRSCSTARRGVDGLYIFPLGSKIPNLFTKAGRYLFSFFIKNSDIKSYEAKVDVNPTFVASKWQLLNRIQSPWELRMGQCYPCIDLACYDEYENRIPFSCLPNIDLLLNLKRTASCRITKATMELSHDKLTLHFKDVTIESKELDQIRPTYDANLVLCSTDALFSVTIPCQGSFELFNLNSEAEVTMIPQKFSLTNVEILPRNFGHNLYPGCVIQQLQLEFVDAYGNHAMGGTVAVILSGFTFQDNVGSEREIDDHGCLNLGGVLKVTAEHGQSVSISLVSESQVLRKMEFQIKRRFIKLASELPDYSYTGTQLEEVRFEVVDEDGYVDETIHNEGPRLESNMLVIKTDTPGHQIYAQYAFERGRCTVPTISLPKREGFFCFTAAHSSHPDIDLQLKVKVIHEPCTENENIDYKSPNGKFPFLIQATMISLCAEEQEFHRAVLKLGRNIKVLEEELNSLQIQKQVIEQDMLALQELHTCDHFKNSPQSKQLVSIIEGKAESAASLVCNLLTREALQEPIKSFMTDILGIVSQLGTVQNEQLSRVLAEYLGKDQMLAVVCRTGDAASALQKCQDVNAVATTLGKSILRRFDVICLDSIRPFTGDCFPCDHQMTLALRNPTLENGDIPPGFLGYAVNMVNLGIAHVHITTITGHGLRETLFYRLFGELQVYETLDYMKEAFACGCLNQTAVSLDGGIARGNGVFSYGFGDPKVCFPVVALESPHLSQDEQETLNQIQEKKMELAMTHDQIMWVTNQLRESKEKFERKEIQYKKFLDQKGIC